jgi:hypothetical protein
MCLAQNPRVFIFFFIQAEKVISSAFIAHGHCAIPVVASAMQQEIKEIHPEANSRLEIKIDAHISLSLARLTSFRPDGCCFSLLFKVNCKKSIKGKKVNNTGTPVLEL